MPTSPVDLDQIFAASGAALCILRGPDHRWEKVSPVFQAREFPGVVLVGRTVREVLPERYAQGLGAVLDQVYVSGQPRTEGLAQRQLTGCDRAAGQCTYTPIREATGEVSGIFVELQAGADSFVEAAALGIFRIAPDGRLHAANPTLARLLGYISPAELPATAPDGTSLLVPDPAQLAELTRRLGREASVTGFEAASRRADGTPIWLALSARALRDAHGAVGEIEGTAEDITERRRADEALRVSEERYRTVAEHFPNGSVLLFDTDLRYLLASGEGIAASGLAADTFAGKTLWEIFPPEIAARDEPVLRAALAGQASRVEVPFGDQTYMVHTLPIADAQGTVVGGLVMTQDITERKQAEAREQRAVAAARAAADENAIFRVFFDQGASFSGVMTLDGTVVEANRISLEAAGFSRDEVIGRKFWECGWWSPSPTLVELVRAGTCQAVAGRLFRQEMPYFVADGSQRFVDLVISPVTDAEGQVQFLAPTGTDITDRKLAEADARLLIELSEKLRLGDDAGDLLADVARMTGEHLQAMRCYFVEVDEAADRWAVYRDYGPQPSMAGEYRISLYPEAMLALHRQGQLITIRDTRHDPLVAESYDTGFAPFGIEAIVIVPLLRNGQWVAELAVGAAAERDWQPREVALLETIAERTWNAVEKLRLEASQRDYTARLQQLNAASLLIHATTARDELLRVIPAQARTLVGAGHALAALVPDGDWSEALTGWASPGAERDWQLDALPPALARLARQVYDERRTLRVSAAELAAQAPWAVGGSALAPPSGGVLAAPLADRSGASVGVLLLLDKAAGRFSATDEALILQLTQVAAVALDNQALYAQEQRARAQAEEASRLKDEFLATVSHELRTPLTAILGYSQLLQTHADDAAYVARTVVKVVRSARAQAQLIEDLLDVSRIVSGNLRLELQLIDLSTVVRAALDTVRPAVAAKDLRVEVDLQAAVGPVTGDASRLGQVVWNLLANAVKFTPVGGAISVRLELRDGQAQLTVSDTGRGISAAFVPYVFDRFRQAESTSTRTYGGLGLGLAIVRQIVELHGGTVAVVSSGEGLGASFTVCLPLAAAGARPALDDVPAAAAEPPECPPELAGLRVLVVDDQPDILELLHDVLAPCGAIVRSCQTAVEALAAVRAWLPDVLVSDIAMPGDDGYWLIRQVRALAPTEGGAVPAVALTAYVRLAERVRVLGAGFQQYVPKPVEPAELRAVVASLARSAIGRV